MTRDTDKGYGGLFEFCKVEIFIPETYLEALQNVLIECDAGHIGNYDACMSYSRVISTWRPLDGAKPFSGETGKISHEHEIKAEITCRAEQVDNVIEKVREIHPYEVPVINVIPLVKITPPA